MKEFKGYVKGVDFGGWLSQCSEYTTEHYQTFITKEDFKTVADWGLDHIRVPVDYMVFQNPDGSFIEEGFGYIQNAIDWCKEYGLKMILDLHKTNGFTFDKEYKGDGFFDDATLQSYFYATWTEFAKRYGKYEDMLAFELLNEVTSPSLSDKWNAIIENVITKIREIAPTIKILVGGYWNNSIDALKDLEAPFDENIVYNFHCYDPFLFTHQGAGWVGGMPRDLRMNYPCEYDAYNKKAKEINMTDFLMYKPEGKTVADPDFFIAKWSNGIRVCNERNIPLYCGEYGVIDNANPEDALKWYKDITEAFKRENIGRASWSYKSMSFGLRDEHMKGVFEELLKVMKS